MDEPGKIKASFSQGVRVAIAGATISILLPLAGLFGSIVAPTDSGQSLSALSGGLILFGVVCGALMAAGGVAYDVLKLPQDLPWGRIRYVHPVVALLFPLWVVIYESQKRKHLEESKEG
jgi:hypothetical protein